MIGTGANASGTSQYSIVMGSGAGATREHSTVLGSKANSIVDGGVALGANSVSDRQDGGSATGHRSTYEPYIPGTADPAQIEAINKTKGTTGAVSVGASATSSSPAILRQITNLAAGAEDTDAVNVAQLKAAVTTAVASSSWNIKENSTQKDVVNSGDNVSFANGTGTTATVEVTDSDKTSTVKYSVNKSNLNVATDGTVTAANTGDNFATADQVAQAINKSEKTTAINNSTTITAKPTTVGTVTTYDLDLTQETKDKIQQGIDANTTVNTKGITFTADNAGAKTERKLGETLAINGDKTLINTTVEAGKVSIAATDKLKTAVTNAESALQEIVTTVNGTTAQTVNKNSNKANFINGKNIELTPSKDGITVATKENVDFTTVNATTVNATTVNGNTIKSGNVVINQDGINAGGQTITNVKAGDKGTDAVNLNQLNEVKNTANAGWNLQANGQNGSNVKPNETVSLNNTDNNIVISKDANNDNVTFGLNSTLNIGNTKPIKIDGTTGTISGLVSTLPTSSTLTAQTKPTTTDAILSSAATVGDVLNSGWNLQGNSQAVDFVSAYDTVNFVSGSGTTAEVTVDAGKAASTVKYSVNKSDLTVAPNGTVTASNKGDNFATADQVAKAINDSEKTSSVVSSTKTIKVTSKVDGKNTEYDLDLSETTKTSLQNADNALQSWTAQANGQAVKTVSKDNATLNFVNGTNIQVTNDNGQVKIATVDAPTFTTVTAGTVNAENFTTGTVSITDNGINAGNQKITNLANGTANSDAVTLAQLNASKSVVQAGNNTHVRSETVTDGSTVYTVDANATTVSGSNALNITKSDAGNNVTNYALDLSDKTKGEIKQGVDANTTVNTKGLTFTADSGTDTLRKLGETLAINGDATLINTKVEAGKVSVVATKTLTDAVTNATSALQSIVTTADSKDAQTVNKDSNKANFISGTNIQLTGTKEGITVATKESVDFTTVNATTVNATTVNGDTIKSGDVVITKDGINAGNQTISNVKDGTISENSKEAVNGSQLYTTNQNVTNNTANITKNATDIAKGTVYEGDHAQTTTNEFKRALGEKTKVVGGAAKDDLSDNNIGVVSNGVDTLTVKLAKTLENLTNATFGSNSDKTVIDKDGVTITNGTEPNKTVSLTESGLNNGGQKITNVAKGEKDSDAVNVSQLKEYVGDNSYNWTISDGTKNEAVADNGIVSVKGSANDNSATTPGIVTTLTGTDITVDLSTKTKDDIKQGVDANTTVNTKGLTFTADNAGVKTERKLGETLAINGDATLINTKVEDGKVSVTATDKLQTAVTSAESALQSIITTANGVDAQTVNKNSNKANFTNGKNIVLTPSTTGIEVATKDEVDFTTVNATTLNGTTIKSGDVVITKDGINAGNQTISNVKDGTISENSKEAVNGSQLYATNQNVTNNTNNIAKNTADIAKGTVYAGDVGNSFTRPLGETTNVKGGATDNLSDNNIGVVSDGKDTLTVKLAKTLTDLTSAEFGEKDSSDKTVINKDGVTVSSDKPEKEVSLTDKGLNNGNNQI
ncbi:beta strand repeat-containing protein, partial [Actinobacillus pleuropneumoniae]